MLLKILLVNIVLCISLSSEYIIEPGPAHKATKGEIWPLPEKQEKTEDYYVIRPQVFSFKAVSNDCELLEKAFVRYWNLLNKNFLEKFGPASKMENDIYHKNKYDKIKNRDSNFVGFLDVLDVNLTNHCEEKEYPYFGMPEDYTIVINDSQFQVSSGSIWGILRGLESFSQLVHLSDDAVSVSSKPKFGFREPEYLFKTAPIDYLPLPMYVLKIDKLLKKNFAELIVNSSTISDRPRYSHRGLLLDTSRHFISKEKLFENLDAMTANKLNVFHWHLTDDQSFPYKSIIFPNISEKGAYHPIARVYEPEDVQEIIEYARVRGIRVMPEFDSPGHTRSLGVAFPHILTACYSNGSLTGQLGPVDPSKDTTYSFLEDLLGELISVFPDQYIHLGGDEVGFECWQSNPDILKFMEEKQIRNFVALESYYIDKVVNIVKNLNASSIVWEEVFTNGVKIPENTIVHVWIEGKHKNTMRYVTAAGINAILSACWYLDHLQSGGDWLNYYQCDPSNFTGTDQQKELVIGGEAAMWAEVVDDFNVISRIWPRTSATAEKLWSINSPNLNGVSNPSGWFTSDSEDFNMVARRLEEHTCRMNRRGIGAQPPTATGFCL